MDDSTVSLMRANESHQPALLRLIALFCDVDGHPFDETRIKAALMPLLEHDDFGRIYLIVSQDEAEKDPAGYLVTTWGYSLESGGREALIDEIFVRDRGTGLGSVAMMRVLETLKAEGFKVIFLETERLNRRARQFYGRFGFVEDDSIWMSRRLNPSEDP